MLESELKNYIKSIGFDDVGIASVSGELPFLQELEKAHKSKRFGPLDYLGKTIKERLDVRTFFPQAKSIIVLVKNYYTGDHPDSLNQGKIARYAWGKDYHHWFKKKHKLIKRFLDEKHTKEPVDTWGFNDTGPFLERAWAYKAGLGFIGKSSMFIHRDFGTWTLLGGMATNIRLKEDPPYKGPDCGSCNRCLEACPTGAIVAPKKVEINRCISTWNIEKPLHPDSTFMAARDHSWVFGCDICQEVCPWNKFSKITEEDRFQPIEGRVVFNKQTLTQDLRGSALYRAKKSGLLVNYLRIRKSLKSPSLRVY